MANRACILLFVLCIQFDPSLQQRQKLRKRLDYMEVMLNSLTLKNIKTQFDISEMRDAIELLNNKTEGESSVHTHVDVSPIDAAAIAGLESEMKKAVNQQDLTIAAIAKAVSDEKKYTRQSISDLTETKEMNSKLKKEVEENKKEILELRQMIMEMKQTKNERRYSSAVPVSTHLPSTAVPVSTHLPSTAVPVPVHLPPCPDGWVKFQDTCYLHVTQYVSWDVAETRCAERGGILAEPDTEEKMRYVLKTFPGGWLGGTDRQTEGTWVWSGSKKNITFFLWYPGQPDNLQGDQDCMYIAYGHLRDVYCRYPGYYICEKKATVQ